jgi:hypothetical protein
MVPFAGRTRSVRCHRALAAGIGEHLPEDHLPFAILLVPSIFEPHIKW